jgi:hypothetical protein
MQDDARMGKDNISTEDMIVPRVALMQAIHSEVQEGKAEAGHFFHTVMEEDLGAEVRLIVIHHSKRYTLWRPRHEGGGVLARASDGVNWDQSGEFEISPYKDRPKYRVKLSTGRKVGPDSGLGRWGTLDPENPDSPPAATLTHVFVCVDADNIDRGPFVVLLQRSAMKVAKGLLSKINIDSAPIFGQVYRMSSRSESSASGDFNQYTFAKDGHVETAEMYNFLKEQHLTFVAAGVKFDEAAEQPEDVSSNGDDDGDSEQF